MPTIHEYEHSFHLHPLSYPYTIHAKFSHHALPITFFPTSRSCRILPFTFTYSSLFPGHQVSRELLTLIIHNLQFPSYPRQCVALATFPLLLAGISFILITTPLHNGSWDSTMSYSYLNLLPLNDDVGYRCHFIHSWISSRPAHVHSHTTTP
jgi:hypothetical protein